MLGKATSERETERTLQDMAALIRRAAVSPAVVAVARDLVVQLDGRAQYDQARTVRAYVARWLRFRRDPRGTETLAEPAFHLAEIARRGVTYGDCDDAATLAGALCMALGLPVRLEAIAFGASAPYAHVYALTDTLQDGQVRTVDFDTTAADAAAVRAGARRVLELVIL